MNPRRRLICTLGESPAVVTEALDWLLFKEGVPVHECVAVHTSSAKVRRGRQRLLETLGVADPGDQPFRVDYRSQVPGEPSKPPVPLEFRLQELPFEDYDQKEHHGTLKAHLGFLIAEARQEGRPVDACLAGGRKTESAVAAIAAQFFGADRVFHVLVPGDPLTEAERKLFHLPYSRFQLVELPLLNLSRITYRILEARRERIASPEDASRILTEFEVHIPALAAGAADRLYSREPLAQFGKVRTRNKAYGEVLATLKEASSSLSTIFLHGESGTGKERLAEAVHQESPRNRGPLVSFALGELPETTIQSELFGHEEGAFTGASRRHRGVFERAEGGTLFIDEMGKAAPALQHKILRVLENKQVLRMGGTAPVCVDFRLITAMSEDPSTLVPDLAFRITVVNIRIPPLRERREDIPTLAREFLKEFKPSARDLRPEELALLENYPWPGNVRELRGTIEAWCSTSAAVLPTSRLQEILRDRAKLGRSSAHADPASRTLDRILKGDTSFKAWAAKAGDAEIRDLLVKAREYYNRELKHLENGPSRADWFKDHFGMKDPDPRIHRLGKGR